MLTAVVQVPGDIVISTSVGKSLRQSTAFVASYWPGVMRLSPNAMYSASSPAYTWTFDGRFRKTHKAQKIKVEDFLDLRDPCRIIDLPIYPSRFAGKDLIEALRQRGRQFWRCRGKRYVSLHSDAYDDDLDQIPVSSLTYTALSVQLCI